MLRNPKGPFGKCLGLAGLVLAAGLALFGQTPERKVIKRVPPEYPALLKQKRIFGIVKLNVVIRPDGTVKDVTVLGGNPILADSSVRAVKQWKFAPAEHESTMPISVEFDPNS